MGASFSNRTAAEKSLGSVLPSVCVITKRDWKGKALAWRGWLVFYSKEGRDRFIEMTLLLMSDNGRHDLSGLQFQVYYLRAQKSAVEYQAAIVAIEGRTAKHTFIPEYTGTSHEVAFAKLKVDIEQRVGKLLKSENIKTPTPLSSTLQPGTNGGCGNVQPPPYIDQRGGST